MRPEGPLYLVPFGACLVPQSLARVLVHLIFSTKNREPVVTPALRTELFPYLSAVLNHDGCPSLRVGGVADHVHLLFGLSRTRCIADVVENVKTSSSKWIKTRDPTLGHFHWQAGYGVFSVSQSNTAEVVKYISNQEEHHRTTTFQEEFRAFLHRHGMEFDERYLWD